MTDLHRDDGFSTMEVLVVVILVGTLAAAATASVTRTLQVSAQATVRVDALTALQRAHERMTRNIRAADPVIAAAGDAITVTVHDDETTRRRIAYAVVADTLEQTIEVFDDPLASTPVSTETTPLIEGLAPPLDQVFTYTDANGQAWDGADPAEIARVAIAVAVDIGEEDPPVPLESSVFVRNTAT